MRLFWIVLLALCLCTTACGVHSPVLEQPQSVTQSIAQSGATAAPESSDIYTPQISLPVEATAVLEPTSQSPEENAVEVLSLDPEIIPSIILGDTYIEMQWNFLSENWSEVPALSEAQEALVVQFVQSSDTLCKVQCMFYSTFVSDALISGIITFRTSQDADMQLITLNLDCATGEDKQLSDFFSEDDTRWRNRLPEIVAETAAQKGMTLLHDVPPPENSHPFFIKDNVLILLYRPYEITTYQGVWPMFVLHTEDLLPYINNAYRVGIPADYEAETLSVAGQNEESAPLEAGADTTQ